MSEKKERQVCIVTVTGEDKVGIIARLAMMMADANINIIDVNQKIMEDYFVMTMAADISESELDVAEIREKLDVIAKELSLNITLQNEKIFKVMHRV